MTYNSPESPGLARIKKFTQGKRDKGLREFTRKLVFTSEELYRSH